MLETGERGGAGRPKKVMSFFYMHTLVRIVFLAACHTACPKIAEHLASHIAWLAVEHV